MALKTHHNKEKQNTANLARYIYKDGINPVAKMDEDGNVLDLYVYGEKDHVPSYMVRNGSTYRYVTDHRGSVKMVVNTDTDAVVQEIEYTAYGEVVTDTNPGFQPFYFAGGMYDQHTMLIRFGARDYDPETGSWIQRDPIRFDGGLNLYGYVGGDPVNFVDVTGLAPGRAYSNINVGLFATMKAVHLATTGRKESAGKTVEWATVFYMVEDEHGVYFSYSPIQEGIDERNVCLHSLWKKYKHFTKDMKVTPLMFVHSHPLGGILSDADILAANNRRMSIMAMRYENLRLFPDDRPIQRHIRHLNKELHAFKNSQYLHLKYAPNDVVVYFRSLYGGGK